MKMGQDDTFAFSASCTHEASMGDLAPFVQFYATSTPTGFVDCRVREMRMFSFPVSFGHEAPYRVLLPAILTLKVAFFLPGVVNLVDGHAGLMATAVHRPSPWLSAIW
jgi:hypothetical protein